MTPLQTSAKTYVKFIRAKYQVAKAKNISRLSPEWGMWSRKMNLEIRKRIESKNDPEELSLKYVFVYWTLMSQLLEIHHKGKFIEKMKSKGIAKRAKIIRKCIVNNDFDLMDDFTDFNMANVILGEM